MIGKLGGGMVIVLALLGGCAPSRPPATQPVAVQGGADEVAALRVKFENQGFVFGQVLAVYPDAKRAGVGDLPTSVFAPGDVVSFVDLKGNTIAFGRVAKIEPDMLHVVYDASGPGQHAPTTNDFAVSLKKAPPATMPATM